MARTAQKLGVSKWMMAALLCAGAYACGSSSEDVGAGSPGGASGGGGLPPGSGCTLHTECSSGVCENGICTDTGSGGSNAGGSNAGGSNAGGSSAGGSSAGGSSAGGSSAGGASGATGGGGAGGGAGNTTTGPHWPGTGKGWRPLTPGCGPETADQCTGTCEQKGGTPGTTVVRPPATLCFSGTGDATPQDPAVVIEQVIEKLNGKEYVHIRITFDPSFTDNTYGAGSCCGWPPRRGHSFDPDLAKSDHTELQITDAQGNVVMNFKLDYITAEASSPCGFGTLGVAGGDGSMISGNAAHILAVATSLDRNINGCGYCKNAACAPSGDCTIDSPPTDANFTPNPATPNWDYRNVYEVWIDIAAFNGLGFGQAFITYTHASPSKSADTIQVDSTPCPPQWDKPYCPPSVVQEGGNCFGSGGTSGTGGSAGSTGSGGTGGTGNPCPPNQQTYVTSEGRQICTPIPFAGYPNRAPCPQGYVLDIATEGQFCIPAT
jgi:hypothetical protein